ncbi:hypothetical protein RND81_07G011800 [Saponaria officinalis]|uniref:Transcription factor GTE6 n=1 Tax=Saponaria officinalis TaxID=3572 RepID=A0AAW1JLV4_SAPOF
MGECGVDEYQHRVDEVVSQVNRIEQRVLEIDQFYINNSKQLANASRGGSASKEKDKDKERHVTNAKKQNDAASREAASTKRMQELIRQFGTILSQISKHKFAWPFMEPVDVKGLGLHDYYEIIEKPMDFGTIKKRMEAKDDSGYKHVREIYNDVRLVFQNAMKYNDEKNKFHVMAKTLLEKFEDKWRQFLPRVIEEDRRREEEAELQLNVQVAQESAYAKLARELSNELFEADMHLEELRETLVQRCRKMSTGEKRQLGTALTRLSTDDLSRALEIVAHSNPGFIVNAEEVDLDIDALTESTLWRLKFFVKDALQAQNKTAPSVGANNNNGNNNNNNNGNININSKRKREISDVLAKTAKKKTKKLAA